MKFIIQTPVVVTLFLFTLIACKKDAASGGSKAVFSYVVDGFKVNFTNFSPISKEYLWDFGDDTDSSTQINPSHTFKNKGAYLVTLTIKNEQQTSSFVDTVLVIGPNIRIDGDFGDWENVEFSHVNEAGGGGTIRAIKTFASADNINFYVEGTSEMAFAVFDLYINADNKPATGFSTWFYPVASGGDILVEGNFNNSNPNLSAGTVYKHVGAPSDFTWDPAYLFSDVMKFSKMKEETGKRTFEFSIQRKALGSLQNFIHFGLLDNNASYTEIGSIPVSKLPTSTFSPIKL